MIDINILLITTCYPPVNVSGSIRALYYTNYMVKSGHSVNVLTVDFPQQFSNYDSTLLQRIDNNINVYREDLGNIYNKFYQKKDETSKENTQLKQIKEINFKSKVRRTIKNNMAIPDSYMMWRHKACKKGIEIIEDNNIDLIFSMHETPSSHLVAYDLKKKFKDISWVAYWSDPWTFDPIRSEYPIIRKNIEKVMEKKVVKLADKNLFTTNECRNLYVKEFDLNEKNTDIVYRGYDANLYSTISKQDKPKEVKEDKINILHAGEIFTKLRDINPLIKAIRNIKNNNYELYKKLNIILLGGIDDTTKIGKFNDIDIINVLPRKSFDEAVRYINSSDILILFGNKNSNQMPGKVYDYLGTDKIILTILGDEKDPLKSFMKNINRGPICINLENEIEKVIIDCSISIDSRNIDEEWQQKSVNFEWDNVVEDLLSKIK